MAVNAVLECVDFSQFMDTLKKMRSLDDSIVYALNTLPTESFKAQKDCQVTCKELHAQLENSYKLREEAFNRCIEYSRNEVAELKKKREKDVNNPGILKNLGREQNKMRMLQTEQTVDEVIRGRTKKVFYERCRNHYLPENSSMSM